MEGAPLVRMVGISKSFGPVQALQDVDFEVYPNEIVGLVGDNGAGKTTLIKILCGVYQPDKGEIYFQQRRVKFKSAREARDLGIEVSHQDLALVDQLNVYRNIFLGSEETKRYLGIVSLLDEKKMANETDKLMDALKVRIPSVNSVVGTLSGGMKQAVAISRCVYFKAKLVILDEPTAALGVSEAEATLELIRRMKETSSVVVITHNLQHIFSVVDRIVVLRHGRIAGNRPRKDTTQDEIYAMILARPAR